ncbi:MAG TPA: hypothetical protein PK648_08280 [Verrucomicrobiales bacterium]|nr:hypothetical protein [Verrucomicrobiales bacterium]
MPSLQRLIRDCHDTSDCSPLRLAWAVNLEKSEPWAWVYQLPAFGFQRIVDGRTWELGITVVDVSRERVKGRCWA